VNTMVILDTSIIIDISRKKQYAIDLIASHQEKEQIATTIITQYEMLRGTPEPHLNYITGLLNRFVILEFTADALDETVKIYKELKEKGTLINELDIIIAGIAAANNETLITKDKDFLNLESNKITILQNEDSF
jgi:tRNA(fMet)-specific endonuclease VapC